MFRVVISALMVVAVAGLAGCNEQAVVKDLSGQLNEVKAGQAALLERIAALETQNELLKAQLEKKEAEAPAAVATAATNEAAAPMITPDVAQALAKTINEMVLADIDRLIDARIASQVGTAQDIEGYFVEAFDQQMEVRQEREREEREAERREWRERAARGSVDRMAEVVKIDDYQKDEVYSAYTNMQSQLRQTMREMRDSGDFNMDSFREAREKADADYQATLQEIMTTDQYETYESEWRGTNSMDRMRSFFGFGGRGGRGGRGGGR